MCRLVTTSHLQEENWFDMIEAYLGRGGGRENELLNPRAAISVSLAMYSWKN